MSQPTHAGSGSSSPPPVPGTEPTRDHTPPAEQLHGAHDTYDQGEVGSIGALVSDIAADMSSLMRQELALAKAEAKESAIQAGKGAGMLGAAGVAAHVFLIFITLLVMFVLAELFDSLIWASLVVAVLWGITAAVLAIAGRSQLKKVRGMPRTTETVKAVPDAIKGNEDRT